MPFRRTYLLVPCLALVSLLGARLEAHSAAQSGSTVELPRWAYPVLPPAPAAPKAAIPSTMGHVPGSTAEYNLHAIPSLQVVPDWFPDEHPPMPPVVGHGRLPDIGACGHCHLPTGMGRPENQSVAGLPAAYMLQQVEDFRSGARHSSEPRMASVEHMILDSRAATPDEIKAGVAYFASLKPHRWIRVVETDTVPATKISALTLVVVDPDKREPIGNRVVEISEDQEQTELRNPHSGFVAYVPKGSLQVGESLVRTGGDGKTIACTTCHGATLHGVGNVPSIAGRSPSQMAFLNESARIWISSGANAAQMKGPVAKLSASDIVAITGYLASLEP